MGGFALSSLACYLRHFKLFMYVELANTIVSVLSAYHEYVDT